MYFGSVGGAREQIATLRDLLTQIGPTGSITIEGTAGTKEVQVTDSARLRFDVPTKIDFEIKDSEIHLKLKATAFYKVAKRNLSYVTITMDRIVLGLDWFPDGVIKVES